MVNNEVCENLERTLHGYYDNSDKYFYYLNSENLAMGV